jgi:hypothetical protein
LPYRNLLTLSDPERNIVRVRTLKTERKKGCEKKEGKEEKGQMKEQEERKETKGK